MKPVRRRIVRWADGRAHGAADTLAAEEPLELRVDTRSLAVVMRTPGHDDELAAGFLLTEGLVRRRADMRAIETNRRNRQGNVLDVFLAPDVPLDFARLTRHVFASSSCGLCGAASIAAVRRQFPPVRADFRVAPETLLALPERMRAAQADFAATGGLHAAALFTVGGELLCLREDIGRHNALDKVLGRALLDDALPLDRHVLLVSGRVSFELVQKALAGGIACIAAVGAPSSLAVAFARRNGPTL
ncbi:MAG TPA: formate dehydrogenase accessory sulfurtransferase FdhD, partial [Verrucomicrobiota bacterium]|nr:formate dehydrogenase accessory sulfurtransferase FdhD [Verrucomicrobiota bacterium]